MNRSEPDAAIQERLGHVEGLHRLQDRLYRRATEEGLADVTYRTVDSPVGSLLLAATDRGLVRVGFAVEGHDTVLTQLAERISPRVLADGRRLEEAARELGEYFDRRRTGFDLALDLRGSSGFRLQVLHHLQGMAFGTTESYRTVAAATGRPKASRAVGTACATNPLPIVVPCHRVLRTDGTLGGYLGGLSTKRALLDLEAAA